MAKPWLIGRQHAEALVDFLEEHPARMFHDASGADLAAELRDLFGMISRENETPRPRCRMRPQRTNLPPYFDPP